MKLKIEKNHDKNYMLFEKERGWLLLCSLNSLYAKDVRFVMLVFNSVYAFLKKR